MQAGLHAVGWGVSRFAIALGLAVVAAILAYVVLIFVIVAAQAATALGTG
jgi:hypothetical protein